MTTSEKYTAQIIFALRSHDVPGKTIGEVVAKVESHLAETGEAPSQLSVPMLNMPRIFLTAPPGATACKCCLLVLGFLSGSFLTLGITAQLRDQISVFGVWPLWAIIIGGTSIFIFFISGYLIWKKNHRPAYGTLVQ